MWTFGTTEWQNCQSEPSCRRGRRTEEEGFGGGRTGPKPPSAKETELRDIINATEGKYIGRH